MTSAFVGRVVGGGADGGADLVEVERGMRIFADPDHGTEIRRLPGGMSRTLPGRDVAGLVRLVAEFSRGATAVWWSLNSLPANLGHAARKDDVLHRRWLLVDCDPVRPAEANATDEEKEHARAVAEAVHSGLCDRGWQSPVLVDSGNGVHLYYRIDLPAGRAGDVLVGRALKALRRLYQTPEVVIDTGVASAAQHGKVPGTWARKGPVEPGRPHRMARLLHVPALLDVVPAESLRDLAGPDPAPPPPSAGRFRGTVGGAGGRAYGLAALDRELAKIRLTGPTTRNRNTTLNASAFVLYQLVAGGALSDGEVTAALRGAARAAGLSDAEADGVIGRAREAGARSPRAAPARPQDGNGHRANGHAAAAAKASGPPAGDATVIVRASEVTPRKVEWLWPGRIPLGKLTTFAGPGGLGKTFVLCDITARVTRGLEWPDGSGSPQVGNVVFVSGEDDADDTLVPRLMELNADLSRVAFLRTEVLDRFTLHDLATLTRAVEQCGEVRFVAIDPPTAYLGGIDDHKNAELRQLLSPLKNWCAAHRIALVFNTHINKGGGQKVEAAMRVMGSVAWVNAVRAAYMFARDPDDPDRRFFVGMKNNLAKERKGLAYRVVPSGDELARINWEGEIDVTADQAVNREKATRKRDVVAAVWLADLFGQATELPSTAIYTAARETTRLSKDALFEAKERMGILARQQCGPDPEDGRQWWWVWPPDRRRKWEADASAAGQPAGDVESF